MKSIFFKLFFVILGIFSGLQASQDFCYSEENILHSFYPKVDDDLGFWIKGELLYLKPYEKSVVMTNRFTDLFTSSNVTLKAAAQPDFKWNFGYRFGFGHYLPSNWDMSVNWTHFNGFSTQSLSCTDNISLGMFPTWSLSSDTIPYDWVSEARMTWKMNLNLIDVDFGYPMAWENIFLIRPFVGLRYFWIKQDMHVKYGSGIFSNGLDLPDLGTTFGFDNISMRNDCMGIGFRCGIEPQINLGYGFRLYGGASGTFGYGFFNTYQKEVYLTDTRYKRISSPSNAQWMLDASTGVMYKSYIMDGKFAITCKLGWEWHMFYDQMKLRADQFGLVSNNRNLILNGAAFSFVFDF